MPEAEPGGVGIAVSAAALNFGDIARCRGGVASVMAQPPFTLGMEVCGVVDGAGAGAEHWIGRRVVAMCAQSFGGMADAALAPATGVFDAPPERGAEVHAALGELIAAGAIRPYIGRRIGLGQVARSLEDHEARRTCGRTVVDLSLPA